MQKQTVISEYFWKLHVFFLQLMATNNEPSEFMDYQLKADQIHQYSMCLCSDFNLHKIYCVKTYKLKAFCKRKFSDCDQEKPHSDSYYNFNKPNKILFHLWDARACCCKWFKTQLCSTVAKCSCAKFISIILFICFKTHFLKKKSCIRG